MQNPPELAVVVSYCDDARKWGRIEVRWWVHKDSNLGPAAKRVVVFAMISIGFRTFTVFNPILVRRRPTVLA